MAATREIRDRLKALATGRLEGRSGRAYWRSLEELAAEPAFHDQLLDEFPSLEPVLGSRSRRDVLRIMGASLGLAGLAGCDFGPPQEKALPYVRAPEFEVPGDPEYYATAALLGGYALPVLAETHVGRPVKVEGNPEHPVSRGATDLFAQAAVLDLYDPDRSGATTRLAQISTFDAFQIDLIGRARELEGRRGSGLALLTGAVTSPTTLRLIERARERLPELRWFVHEPVGNARRHEAARLAFGRILDLHPRLDRAEVTLCLEADPLGPGPAQVPNARAWVDQRRAKMAHGELPKLYVLESTPSLTGAKASEALPAAPAEIHNATLALAQHLGIGGIEAPELPLHLRAKVLEIALALERSGEAALVMPGAHLDPQLQALVFRINQQLGGLNRTLVATLPVEARPEVGENSLPALAGAIRTGEVDTLLILDSNPVYTAPADLDIGDLLQTVPFRVHVGAYQDETAALCPWHVPLAHPFETWSDGRAVDGTASVIQPLVRPVRGGRSMHEVLATLAGEPQAEPYEMVRATWRRVLRGRDFEPAWRQVLHDGFAEGTAAETQSVEARPVEAPPPKKPGAIEAVVRPDPSVWDGRFATNAWLQELPKPFTKLTWDNVVAVSPAFAVEHRLDNGDLVDLSAGVRRVRAPVWILPGQAERTLTLHLGYGRGRFGGVGSDLGYDAYRLRTTDELWVIEGMIVQAADASMPLASTQEHHSMLGHHLVREIGIGELAAGRSVVPKEHHRPTLYPEWDYETYAWAMTIDLDACIGCNACVVACQAENNVPVVGKEEVLLGREMHWLRVDRYYSGEASQPHVHFQPIPCMHCEKAPCEMGCPVNATVHGPEGLNQMIYNRCVGTRTCASYCPYKVRRFNFHDYTADEPPTLVARRNPDLTVRARGVMEKCTYCVQRISAARIEAKKEGRRIRDGEVVTACQQVCPTRAIVFGDQSDPDSMVARAKASPRDYALLAELNLRPRTSYLAEVSERPAGDHRLEGEVREF
ncbi:MAG TPA: TAT-variant-translocated molybdopterin oxidoreductase [Geminicoccaceae bacterium]